VLAFPRSDESQFAHRQAARGRMMVRLPDACIASQLNARRAFGSDSASIWHRPRALMSTTEGM
jgi:hypothetical protein